MQTDIHKKKLTQAINAAMTALEHAMYTIPGGTTQADCLDDAKKYINIAAYYNRSLAKARRS